MTAKKDKAIKAQKQNHSSLSDFIERPVPSEQEVASFNRAVRQEVRDQEIDSNLSEIYKDRYGKLMDVKTLKVKKKRSAGRRFLRSLLSLLVLAALAYGAYYFINRSSNQAAVALDLQAPERVMAGEEFNYQISYKNTSRFSLNKISLDLKYPDNYIFLESSLPPTNQNSGWQLPDLAPGQTYSFSVKGKLINKQDAPNILNAQLSYTPANFSSEFSKDASLNTIISGLGFEVEATYLSTALLGQDNEVNLAFKNFGDQVYLNDFFLNASAPSNIVVTDLAPLTATAPISENASSKSTSTPAGANGVATSSPLLAVSKISGTQWQITNAVSQAAPQNLRLKYKITAKTEDKQSIVLSLEELAPDGRILVFWEKTLDLEIMKSDLNLTLSVNGQAAASAVDFGQTLNYSLTYANHSGTTLKDVNIRADLQGEFFNWASLQDKNRGQLGTGTILWTKNQIPALAEIAPNQEGEIDFSIALNNYSKADLGRDLSLTSQASYNLSGGDPNLESSERRSNTVINQINSNLNLQEQIRYFDENNIPVGSGPLPPKVGEKTTFKVYWNLTNDLHELSDTQVTLTLPAYVVFEENSNVSVGSLIYDNSNRQVSWEVGRLPVSVKRAEASFNISLTPQNSDLNKILILSSGAQLTARDIETQGLISKKSPAKTTKLEDDDIANLTNSGQVQ